ncbi:MAG: DNA polymerase, partial [Bacteroides sp.]
KMDVVKSADNLDEYIKVDVEKDDLEFVCKMADINPKRYKSGKRKGDIKVERIDSDVVKMIQGKVQEGLKGIVDLEAYPKEFLEDFKSKFTQSRQLQDGSNVTSTSEDALLALIPRSETSSEAKKVLTLLREWAVLNKIIGAFYDRTDYYASGAIKGRSGMLQFVTDEGLIHHSLNMCATKTGRLSSTKPNLQQIPRDSRDGVMPSNIKAMFTSRFGEQGRIVEVDYKALEVVVLADFTGDEELKKAVLNDVDMHCLRAGQYHGIPYDEFKSVIDDDKHPQHKLYDQYRQDIKAPSFAYQYGASARGIAYATGWDVKDAQKFIDTERALFPDVEVFFDEVAEAVEETRTMRRVKLDNGAY